MLPLALAMLLFAGAAFAAGTAASTEITNQASASFNDSSGQPRTTTSNQVVTIVQQVGGVSISPANPTEGSPGQTKRGLPGAPVYFNYIVENTGNDLDTVEFTAADGATDNADFTGIDTVYHDENCNGSVDSGEADVTTPGIELDADESTCAILEATIDSASADGDTLNVNLTVNSNFDSLVTANSWAQAVAETKASFDIRLARTPSGTVSNTTNIEYLFSGTNTGGDDGDGVDVATLLTPNDGTFSGDKGIVVQADVPTGTVFTGVSGSAGAGDGIKFIYFNTLPATDEWTSTKPADADIAKVAMVIMKPNGNNAYFPPGASYEMDLDVQVDNSLDVANDITNSGSIVYSDGTTSFTVTSNTVSNAQAQTYAVSVDPAPTAYTDWPVSVSGTNQTLTGPVYTGDTVLFKNRVTNDGTAEDYFDLSLAGQPVDWSCGFRQVDGTTPLSGPVGPLPEAATFDFAVACAIGSEATTGGSTVLSVTATSRASASANDTATDTVPAVSSGYGVLFTSAGGSNLARVDASGVATTANIQPGGMFYIPLKVSNNGDNADVFDLSIANLPTDWTLVIHEDGDPGTAGTCSGSDGIADNSPTTKSEILEGTGVGAEVQCFVAVGTLPSDEPSGNRATTLAITATSSNVSGTTATVTNDGDDIPVALINTITVDPDRSGTVTSPGTISYNLNVHNAGNDTQTVTVSSSAGSYGWTYQLSTDDGATWSATPTVSVVAGQTEAVKVRVIVPAGEPVARVDAVTVTATDGTSSETATISTTVVGGDLTLDNSARTCDSADCTGTVTSADGSQAEPGEFIEYTLVASNIGTSDISEVILMIPLPSFTEFESASAVTTVTSGSVVYSTDGVSWSALPPTTGTIGVGESAYVGVDTNTDTNITSADTMGASETITVTLVVKVK